MFWFVSFMAMMSVRYLRVFQTWGAGELIIVAGWVWSAALGSGRGNEGAVD